MPQERIYQNAAQRQAAYRQRKGQTQEKQSELAMLARSLHAVVQTAVVYRTFPLPESIAAPTTAQTLRNLIEFLDPIYDPVRNPNGTVQRSRELDMKEARLYQKS